MTGEHRSKYDILPDERVKIAREAILGSMRDQVPLTGSDLASIRMANPIDFDDVDIATTQLSGLRQIRHSSTGFVPGLEFDAVAELR